jgi:predicted helicase
VSVSLQSRQAKTHNKRACPTALPQIIDIVGTRGVEAICFADTRGSQVEIVQNIGRALRPNPDGTQKTARIIVPVFLQPGEDPKDMVSSASCTPRSGASGPAQS